ncbi:MAG: hypothetical protein FWC80_00735 [Firmicutes bacterium]|nr:hypothetical protein [Bacillota bacterium]
MEEFKKKTCRKCGSQENVKWGKRNGVQCHRCKQCGFQFTIEVERRARVDECRAITLHAWGFSFRAIGKLMSYHHTAIMRWINERAAKNDDNLPLIDLEELYNFAMSQKKGKEIAAKIELLMKSQVNPV